MTCGDIYVPPDGEHAVNLILVMTGTLSFLGFFFLLHEGFSIIEASQVWLPFLFAWFVLKKWWVIC